MPTADSAGVTGLEVAAGPKVPVDDAANVPAAGGQILPDLTRAVCGYLETWCRIGVRPDSVQVLGETLSMRLPAGVIGMALSWHALSPGTARGEARKGYAQLEVAVPSLPDMIGRARGEASERDHRNGPAQEVSPDRGRG